MPFTARINETLARHALRATPIRRQVLQVLLSRPYALSSNDIEQALGEAGIDRITLYRTLRTFEQQGVIHRVIDATDIIRYAACATGCTEHAHYDNHVHFKCTTCQHTYCLNQVSIPPVVLPGRFQAERSDYLMSGVCSQCRPVA
ncbi:Fur family transcriptional regulator [Hymenobacter canadensis]|uniref:Transcriptional repressor n=1 Tax=Hymenobacter canadensis TaxID=2999067 RepID=A0ABY7LXW8_9BACT|nr:transcriptional repressor [Hymenobacter canadensis]WBA43793.1 transcriptional repressor [Hymenobacter canadensis]